MKRASGPFGKHRVVDYFLRYEFQHRGSPHCHTLLWLKDVPQVNEHIEDTTDLNVLIRVIDTLICTDSNKLCNTRPVQRHNHTHTCYKKSNKACKFGIPYWPMDCTRILTPINADDRDESTIELYKRLHRDLETNVYGSLDEFLVQHMIENMDYYVKILRHGITRPKVFLKRSMADIWTCPFNTHVSRVLQSNMDIQFILDAFACAAYVAKYINKSERGFSSLHRALIEIRNEDPELDYEACMKQLGIQVLNKIEICTQEAAWILLRLPMCERSRAIRFIPTKHPAERYLVRKRKSKMDAEALSGSSTNVWTTNVIHRYEARNDEYANIHSAELMQTMQGFNSSNA